MNGHKQNPFASMSRSGHPVLTRPLSKIQPDNESNGPPHNMSHSEEDSDYLEMGKHLLNSMKVFDQSTKLSHGSPPSTAPTDETSDIGKEGREARRRVVELAERILASTMEPKMNLMISSMQYHFCSCLKVAVDLNIADHISRYTPMSTLELSILTGAEEGLLDRIMKVLASKYVYREVEPSVFMHTSISWTMSAPGHKYLLTHRLEEGFRSASRQAEALRLNGYREPVSDDKYGFHLAFDTTCNFWDYTTKAEPKIGKNFNKAMKVVSMNDLEMIPELYPFGQLAEHGGLLVDVGGGLGQVGRKIISHYKGKGLRCIVQDKLAPSMDLQTSDDEPAVTMQQHDFFEPQPVKGAAAYFFRHIFHDWPDSDCIAILRKIVPAMDQKTSRILICDQVVEDDNPAISSLLYDIDMMSMYGGKERKLSEWKDLLRKADARLTITDVRAASGAPHIIEVKLSCLVHEMKK